MEEVKKVEESLDSKAGDTVAKFSKTLVSTIHPEVAKARDELFKLTIDISNKTMGINSKLVEIDNKLINFRVGRAMREYVYTGIVCLVIGIAGTLAITQQSYAGLVKRTYNKEIELAKKEGCKEYQKNLIENNSGVINITKLEKEYVINHRKNFKDPDAYLQSLNERIEKLNCLEAFKDK